MVAGTEEAIERLRNAKPEPRPALEAAFEAAGDSVGQLVIMPTETQRRVFEEMVPTLPKEVGGGPITTLTRGLRWMVLSLRREKDAVSLIVQAKDAEAAQKLQTMAEKGLNLMRQQIQGDASVREMLRALQQLGPRAVEDRVVLNVDLKLVGELVATTVARARASAGRSQCVNNLKMIALAMHNYHSSKKSFPPAYNQGPDGKPLLSWRVHILPYLDQQQALYDEFHLDEPWDSPHNKALIAKMPAVYACPSVPGLAESGKTTYLGPRGEKTIFPGPEGSRSRT